MGKNRTRYIHPRLKLLPPPRCIIHRRFLHFIRHLVSFLVYFVLGSNSVYVLSHTHTHVYTARFKLQNYMEILFT